MELAGRLHICSLQEQRSSKSKLQAEEIQPSLLADESIVRARSSGDTLHGVEHDLAVSAQPKRQNVTTAAPLLIHNEATSPKMTVVEDKETNIELSKATVPELSASSKSSPMGLPVFCTVFRNTYHVLRRSSIGRRESSRMVASGM